MPSLLPSLLYHHLPLPLSRSAAIKQAQQYPRQNPHIIQNHTPTFLYIFMKIFSLLLILFCLRLHTCAYDEIISAAKISLFIWLDPTNSYQTNLPSLTKSYTFTFPRVFTVSPQVALGLYTFDADYSVYFQVYYQDVTVNNMTVWVSKLSSNALNQIYIMYFGTDLSNFECALLQYNTNILSNQNPVPNNGQNRSKRSQTVTYNFKTTRNASDTYITLYLSGLHIAGELTTSGFSYNYTDFNFDAAPVSPLTFNFTISTSGQVTIYHIEFFYIAYEKTVIESQGRFILNSGVVYTSNYGGVVTQASTPVQLPVLTKNNYTNAQTLFFGLNDLTSQNSQMRILGVEQVFGSGENLGYILLMQTWQYTYILNAGFSYLQVKKIICNLDPYLALALITCPNACPNFNYIVTLGNGSTVCYPCHFSCQTCSNGYSCLTCPSTRVLANTTSNITCFCLPGYYETIQLQCSPCPPQCLTCLSLTICSSCDNSLYRYLQPISRYCQCQFGYTSPSGTLNCLPCLQGCASCQPDGTCSACIFGYFWVNKTFCAMICSRYEIYDFGTNRCLPYTGSLTSYPPGRFVYSWTSTVSGNNILVDLVFSDPNAYYYYYQGGNGYNIYGSNNMGNGSGIGIGKYNQGLYYDDGNGYTFGYPSSTTTTSTAINPDGSTTTTTTTTTTSSTFYANNNDSLTAAMYGAYGSTLPSSISLANYTAINFNPYTLGALTSYYYPLTGQINPYRLSGEPSGANYLGALAANLEMRINGELVPFTIQPTTEPNHFILVATPARTYANAIITVNIKDAALIVSNRTVAIQTTNLSMYNSAAYYAALYGANYNNMINQTNTSFTYFDNSNMYGNGSIYYINGTYYFANGTIAPSYLIGNSVDTLNYYIAAGSAVGALVCYSAYTPAQINAANNLANTNHYVSEALWGISKILLFLGFGWQVMPLMMSMQYIFGHYYITTNTPYNLHTWLGSWNDYRNPSIFFHKVRNDMDEKIFPQTNAVYTSVPQYNIYDRGIDFMKNNFQFFLTVIMSFFCLGLLYCLSWFLVCICKVEINFISNYLAQRKMIHFAAYMLIWSLPFSWFFWGQITDTYSRHGRYYNYSNWNLGMTFLVFFVVVIFPAFIMYWIFYGFNYQRVFRFDRDLQISNFLNNNVANRVDYRHMIGLGEPLWSGLQTSKLGYIWAACVYYRLILFGFWTSFFYGNGTNQLIGIIATNIAFLIFTAFGYWFTNPCYKWYFLLETALLIAYEILVGAINSGTYCSNTGVFVGAGYAGIGILYGLFGLGVLFSLYALYRSLMGIYQNYFSKGNIFIPYGQAADTYLVAARNMPLEGRKTTLIEPRRMTNRLASQFVQRKTNIIPGGSFADIQQSERNLIDYVPPPISPLPHQVITTTHKKTEIIPGKVVNLGQQIEFQQQIHVPPSTYTYLKILTDTPEHMILTQVSGSMTKKITLVNPPQYIRRKIRMATSVWVDVSGQIFCDGELLNVDYDIDRRIVRSSTHIDTTNIVRENYIFESEMQDPYRIILVSTLDRDRVAIIEGPASLYSVLRGSNTIEIDTMNRLYINGVLQQATIIQLQRDELMNINNRTQFFRLQFVRLEGNDVILRKVGAKAIIRLEDIDDPDIIRELRNPSNVITSNGTLVFINGINIFQNAQSIRATRRLITNRFIQTNNNQQVINQVRNRVRFVGYQQGAAIMQGANNQRFRIPGIRADTLQRLQNPDAVIERGLSTNSVYIGGVPINAPPATYRVAAVHPNNVQYYNGGIRYITADYTSNELTGRSQIEQQLARAALNYPGFRYIITNVDANHHSESVDDFFLGPQSRLRMLSYHVNP